MQLIMYTIISVNLCLYKSLRVVNIPTQIDDNFFKIEWKMYCVYQYYKDKDKWEDCFLGI